MKRNTIAAIAVAGVLGSTGGVALALQRDSRTDPPANTPSASSQHTPTTKTTPTPKPTKAAATTKPASPTSNTPVTTPPSGSDSSTNEPLLWADTSAVRDGSTVHKLTRLDGVVDRIVRVQGGYVVAERTSSQEPAHRLWFVPRDGGPEKDFADTVGSWDVNPSGTEVVALSSDNVVRVYHPQSGATPNDWPMKVTSTPYVGFMGDAVLVSMLPDGGYWTMYKWDPATGKTSDPITGDAKAIMTGFPNLSVSPGGSYFTGRVTPDGSADADGPCLYLSSTPLRKTKAEWQDCTWQAFGDTAQFSPDGTLLLTVPVGTEGLGPTGVGIIDASDGPDPLVANPALPDGTIDLQWADNTHFFAVQGDPTSGEAPYIISRCDFSGTCVKITTTPDKPVLASTP